MHARGINFLITFLRTLELDAKQILNLCSPRDHGFILADNRYCIVFDFFFFVQLENHVCKYDELFGRGEIAF